MAVRRRRGFKHWITGATALPEKLADEELQGAYDKLRRDNDLAAAEQIIRGHIRLGLSKVAEFAVRSPDKIEDMASEMLEVLTEGCQKLAGGAIDHHTGTPNVTGYLMAMVRGRLLRFVTTDGILRLSHAAYLKLLERRGEGPQVVIFDGDDLISRRTQQYGEWNRRELQEVLDKSIAEVQARVKSLEPNLVRRVIEMRIEGLKDPEIGYELDLTGSRVHQIRKQVQKALLEKL